MDARPRGIIKMEVLPRNVNKIAIMLHHFAAQKIFLINNLI